jgi:uncharacterized protein (TIGR02246 family)
MDEQARHHDAYAAIAAARATFVVALKEGDAAAAAVVYCDDASLLPPSADLVKGRAAIAAFWHAGVGAGISEVELDAVELRGDHGLAYEIGRYALRLEPADGGSIVDRGRYLLVHAQQADGSWRRAAEMFTPDAQRG